MALQKSARTHLPGLLLTVAAQKPNFLFISGLNEPLNIALSKDLSRNQTVGMHDSRDDIYINLQSLIQNY